nr:integrase, catalytic region, zinc finger, CCHC-type, peptidase aspartic, catalytic [Tanacetum cinerariifolium]
YIARKCTQPNRPQNSNYYKDKMLLMQAQENEVALDEENLLFLAADDYDAFDSDVDEAPTAQTMFMANLSSADPVYHEAGPSYDSDIQSEVHDHDHYQDAVCEDHEEHAMHDNVQLNYVVDSHTDYTSDSNMIPYDQDNAVPEDTLEIAKITRRKMNDKMKDPECVNHKSQDLIKMKTEALKEKTTSSRLIKALLVYPLNTPAMLIPKVLPTKSQVKIHIFTLIQLFSEFDKTCRERITSTGLTEGERVLNKPRNVILRRFTEMHVANTIVEAGCLELEAELSTLRDKSHNDNHNELVNRFSNLEVIQIVLWYLDSGCSKHMTGDRSWLINFVKKFIGTVIFRNDHFGAIMGYRDYVIGDSVISKVYYVKGLGHNLFSIRQFCDSDLEVAFRKHSCYVRDMDGVELIKGSRGSNLYTISVEDMMKVFGALFYPKNDSKDLGKLQPTIAIGIFVGYAPSTKGPAPIFLTPGHVSSGLVPNLVPAAPYVPPTNKDLENLFQPMFNEYLEPHRVERPVSLAPAVQVPVNSAGTPSSTTIDQDAASPSISSSSSTLQSPSLHQGVAAESTLMEDNPIDLVDNNPFINVFALELSSNASSSGDVSSTESTYVSQTLDHLCK